MGTIVIDESLCTDAGCPGASNISIGDLQSESFLTGRGWDMTNVWCIRPAINAGFPALRIFTSGALDATACNPVPPPTPAPNTPTLPIVALWSATLDPARGSCVDGIAHTEIWTAFFLGYGYLPGASDCTRNGFAFAGWANATTPTTVRTFPVLIDPSDGAMRSFVAENVTLVAVWNPLPATPKFFIGISNWLCNNCGVLLAWDTPAGNPTVTVTNGSSTNVCSNASITVGPWTLCHVTTGRPGTYTLTTSNTTGSSQPIATTVR